MKVLFNILMAIIVWYVPQIIVGYIIGFFGGMMGLGMSDIFMPVCIAGITVSIISEIVYWRHYSVSKRGA